MTKTQTTDLAGSLAAAAREAEAAAQLERQAAAARAKAEQARQKAEAEQAAQRRQWAEGVMQRDADRRREAITAINAATQAFEAATAEPATLVERWMDKAKAQAALYGVERERAAAMRALSLPERAERVPHPDFVGDLTKVMNTWAMDLLTVEDERVREVVTNVATGKAAHRG